jgi:hypothetical protein
LLISILLPSLARARELAKRTACAANLKGIGTGLYTYANENNSDFPIAAPNATQNTAPAAVVYVGKTGVDDPGRGKSAANCQEVGNPAYTAGAGCPPAAGSLRAVGAYSAALSTTRNLWTLVRIGASAPKSFVCPSSDDQPNSEDNPQFYWDFGVGDTGVTNLLSAWSQCSYGYQVPYGLGGIGKPGTDRDQRMALSADKGPWSTFTEGGKGTDPATNGNSPTWSGANSVNTTSGPDDWRKFNSPNHGGVSDGEGQNVLYADSHVEFQNKPNVGIYQDNIYTQVLPAAVPTPTTPDQVAKGTPPSGSATSLAPLTNQDSLIWP